MPSFLSRGFSAKTKKNAQELHKTTEPARDTTPKFRVLSSAGKGSSRPPSSSAAAGGADGSRLTASPPRNPPSTPNRTENRGGANRASGSPNRVGERPLSRTSSGGSNSGKRRLITPAANAIASDRSKSTSSDRPVSYVGANTDHSQPPTRGYPQQQVSTIHQASRGSTQGQRSTPPRSQSARPPPDSQALRRLTVSPGPPSRAPLTQNGPYPPPPHNRNQRPSSFNPLDGIESFNSNPAVDRYPRPFVTPKNEFTTPTINGLNPNRSFSRSQSMTSEFAANYSLDGIEGFPGAPSAPSVQPMQRRRNGHTLIANDAGRERAMTFNGATGSGWDNGVHARGSNNIMPGGRGPGGMGMGMSMAGMDGLEGFVGGGRGMGRRGGPGPPPVPRIPSTYTKSSPQSVRNQNHINDMNNYSQYPPPFRNGTPRPRNTQGFPPQFPDFDAPPERHPMHPQSRLPPPYSHYPPYGRLPPPQHPYLNGDGRLSQYPSRAPTRQSNRDGDYPVYPNVDESSGLTQNNSPIDATFSQSGKGDDQLRPTIPAALPTPSLTPTPPSRSNSNEEHQNSDNDSEYQIKRRQEKPPHGHYPLHYTQQHQQSSAQLQNQGSPPMYPRSTAPPSPISAPRTPPDESSSSSINADSPGHSLAQQIRIITPIMPGPAGRHTYTKDISLVMEECIMGHSDIAKDSVMKRTGNWHHSVGCMICGGYGDEMGKVTEDGAAAAGSRWLYLCSWCALRVCGECRCRLRVVEEKARSECDADATSKKYRVDLKALREAVLQEKGAQYEQTRVFVERNSPPSQPSENVDKTSGIPGDHWVNGTIFDLPKEAKQQKPAEDTSMQPTKEDLAPIIEELPVRTIEPEPTQIIPQKPAQTMEDETKQRTMLREDNSKLLAPIRKEVALRARDSGVLLRGGSEESFLSYATAGTRLDDLRDTFSTPVNELPSVLENPPPRTSSKNLPSTEYTATGGVPTLSGPLSLPKPTVKAELQALPKLETNASTIFNSTLYSSPATDSPTSPQLSRKPVPTTRVTVTNVTVIRQEAETPRKPSTPINFPMRNDSLPSTLPSARPTTAFESTFPTSPPPLVPVKSLPAPSTAPQSPKAKSVLKRKPVVTPTTTSSVPNGGFFLPALPFETNHNHLPYRYEEKVEVAAIDDAAVKDVGKKGGRKWFRALFSSSR